MYKFINYDEHNTVTDQSVKLKDDIDSISLHLDGGRLELYINSELVIKEFDTRDCSIEINKD